MVDSTLEELEKQLSPELFFRVSRKYFVNINAIKDIISYTNSRLKIILNNYNETEIIVSRERVKDFKNWIS
jgi:DNA-binding LytR/AlgR family response regulator